MITIITENSLPSMNQTQLQSYIYQVLGNPLRLKFTLSKKWLYVPICRNSVLRKIYVWAHQAKNLAMAFKIQQVWRDPHLMKIMSLVGYLETHSEILNEQQQNLDDNAKIDRLIKKE
jgi:hypothetical protein